MNSLGRKTDEKADISLFQCWLSGIASGCGEWTSIVDS